MAEEDLMGPREFRENPTKLKKSSDKDADDESEWITLLFTLCDFAFEWCFDLSIQRVIITERSWGNISWTDCDIITLWLILTALKQPIMCTSSAMGWSMKALPLRSIWGKIHFHFLCNSNLVSSWLSYSLMLDLQIYSRRHDLWPGAPQCGIRSTRCFNVQTIKIPYWCSAAEQGLSMHLLPKCSCYLYVFLLKFCPWTRLCRFTWHGMRQTETEWLSPWRSSVKMTWKLWMSKIIWHLIQMMMAH